MQSSRAAAASQTLASSGAAPDITRSSADRSCLSTAGCFASASTIGGTRHANVTRCSSISRRNSSRSNRGIVTTVAPLRSARFTRTVMP